MTKVLLTCTLLLASASAYADCQSTAVDAASLVAKLPQEGGSRGFVLQKGVQIVGRDIGTDTYRVALEIAREPVVFQVSLNRRTCQVMSVVRQFE
jgi:hypothetical protein